MFGGGKGGRVNKMVNATHANTVIRAKRERFCFFKWTIKLIPFKRKCMFVKYT